MHITSSNIWLCIRLNAFVGRGILRQFYYIDKKMRLNSFYKQTFQIPSMFYFFTFFFSISHWIVVFLFKAIFGMLFVPKLAKFVRMSYVISMIIYHLSTLFEMCVTRTFTDFILTQLELFISHYPSTDEIFPWRIWRDMNSSTKIAVKTRCNWKECENSAFMWEINLQNEWN